MKLLLRSLLSSLVAVCLLAGVPRVESEDERGGKESRETELTGSFALRHQLPQRLVPGGARLSIRPVVFPPAPLDVLLATTPQPVAPRPAERLPRRLI